MIDSTLFMCDLPAAAYAVGDVLPLTLKAGPVAVRDGYGSAILKEVLTGYVITPTGASFEVVIQNSNMIDPIINSPSAISITSGLDPLSTGVQSGHDFELQSNSVWSVVAKCVTAGTLTAAASMFALIDIDYPSVGSIADPSSEKGIPASIEQVRAVTVNASGSSAAASWNVYNVDNFKPGYRYLLEKIGMSKQGAANLYGFVAIANAAGQNGLCRIVPVSTNDASLAKRINYAAPLSKGPMDYRFLMFGNTAGTDTVNLVTDFVKRG